MVKGESNAIRKNLYFILKNRGAQPAERLLAILSVILLKSYQKVTQPQEK